VEPYPKFLTITAGCKQDIPIGRFGWFTKLMTVSLFEGLKSLDLGQYISAPLHANMFTHQRDLVNKSDPGYRTTNTVQRSEVS
jgi:hypothetical protein